MLIMKIKKDTDKKNIVRKISFYIKTFLNL